MVAADTDAAAELPVTDVLVADSFKPILIRLQNQLVSLHQPINDIPRPVIVG